MVEEHWIEDLEEFESTSQENQAGQARKRQFPGRRLTNGKLPPILLGAGALVLLLILLVGLLGGDDQDGVQARLKEMDRTLTQVQKSIEGLKAKQQELTTRLAEMEPEYKFDTLFQNMNTLSNELESVEKELRSELAGLSKDLKQAEGSGEQAEKPAEPKQAEASQEKPGTVHVVQKGENLFRIGLQYDVSPKKIRQWNGLSSDEPIYPGQELIVSPSD